MMQFEQLIADPPLTKLEQQAYQIVLNLRDAQIAHQFAIDPRLPPPPRMNLFLDMLAVILWQLRWTQGLARTLRRKWNQATTDYYRKYGVPEPRDPAPLSDLWRGIDPPPELAPSRVDGNDLAFDRFLVSQRIGKCPHGSDLAYIVAAPSGDEPFRCLVEDSSGRVFYSAVPKSRCQPPPADDFALYRIHSKAFDLSEPPTGQPTIPTVMELRLPGCYGPWQLMRRKRNRVAEALIE